MAHRYFTGDIQGDIARITGSDAQHLARVLRVKIGEEISLCDGAGWDYTATVQSALPEEVLLAVSAKVPTQTEPDVKVSVYAGCAKGEKPEWALQKSVELGACAFVPFFSQNTVVKPKKEEEKNVRYARIALEAAKQSGRGIVPTVGMPMNYTQMLQAACHHDAALFLYEKGGIALKDALADAPRSIAIITGPEGGFTPEEAEEAKMAGCHTITLGARILRCETAPIAALAAVMTITGNLS